MSSHINEFFEGKRPWSVIKDEVLGSYLPAYLAKVKSLSRPILIVDGFAGPGIFEDGSPGSPIIICTAAEKYANGNYKAFFINKRRDHHESLSSVLVERNWLGPATPILGDTTQILPLLPKAIRNQTVFLYLDPFGPTGSPFSLLEPFLARDARRYSTEIVLMMHMPIVHRLAARKAVYKGREFETRIQQYHSRMSEVFGGDYWKPIMFNGDLSPERREVLLIDAYKAKLAKFLPYVGSCPVRASESERVKYFIVFASRHPDAMLLMNDAMAKAYFKQMHRSAVVGTFFENTSWQDERNIKGLREEILSKVERNPGITRSDLWLKIVETNFMRYLVTEFKQLMQQMVNEEALTCSPPRKTKRLNDDCQFLLAVK